MALDINIFSLPDIALLSKSTSLQFISFIKNAVCYNQGRYIQFEYLLGLNHKDLKDSIKARDNTPNILSKLNELTQYIENELQTISNCNFKYLLDYFRMQDRSKFQPRICIKGTKDGKITDLYRSSAREYFVPEHSVESNSGFEYVVNEGIFFICNNIPNEAKYGRYRNPRLDDNRVRNYNPKRTLFRKDKEDLEWHQCWKNEDNISAGWHRSCYKSTLIVPMTLINNDLSPDFKKRFFTEQQKDNRTIWGFLCFDHPNINYFNEKSDINMGYIFADILSLYYVSAYIHTEISNAYNEAETIGGENEKD